MLLQYAQRPQIISIAGVKPLNMDTCLSVSKNRECSIKSFNSWRNLSFLHRLSKAYIRMRWLSPTQCSIQQQLSRINTSVYFLRVIFYLEHGHVHRGSKKIIDEHKTLVVHVPHSNILQHSSFHSRNNRPTISSRSHHVTTSQFTQQQTAILRNSLSISLYFSVSLTKYLVWKFSPNEKSTCSKDSQIHTHTQHFTQDFRGITLLLVLHIFCQLPCEPCEPCADMFA